MIEVDVADRDDIILGARADDMQVEEKGKGRIDVRIYAFENTGEATLLTVHWGQQKVIVKGDRHLRKKQDDVVSVKLNPDHLYLFDPQSGNRIRS